LIQVGDDLTTYKGDLSTVTAEKLGRTVIINMLRRDVDIQAEPKDECLLTTS